MFSLYIYVYIYGIYIYKVETSKHSRGKAYKPSGLAIRKANHNQVVISVVVITTNVLITRHPLKKYIHIYLYK